nr:LOW QUALITY PROTEIN: uncharacterized protein LOC128699204 [Cherax quadricarinatus]
MQCVMRSIILLMVVLVLVSSMFYMFFSNGRPLQVGSRMERDLWYRLSGPVSARDPHLLEVLRRDFLVPPSLLPYNFSNSSDQIGKQDFTWPWIHRHLQEMFGDQRGGFFVEAGALNGVYLSNTLWLETSLEWTGLLVEPDKESYKALSFKHRKAWSSNTCLSSEPYPKKTIIVSHYVLERNSFDKAYWWSFRGHSHELRQSYPNKLHTEKTMEKSFSSVQCFPLLSYLLALNVSTVDLLSLDVQGTEALILDSFFNTSSVSVRVIVAEDEEGTFSHSHMEKMGYILVASLTDHIYVKKGDQILTRAVVKEWTAKLKTDRKTPQN